MYRKSAYSQYDAYCMCTLHSLSFWFIRVVLHHNITLGNTLPIYKIYACNQCTLALSSFLSLLHVSRRPSGTPIDDCVDAEGVVVRQQVIPRFQEEFKQVHHCTV